MKILLFCFLMLVTNMSFSLTKNEVDFCQKKHPTYSIENCSLFMEDLRIKQKENSESNKEHEIENPVVLDSLEYTK